VSSPPIYIYPLFFHLLDPDPPYDLRRDDLCLGRRYLDVTRVVPPLLLNPSSPFPMGFASPGLPPPRVTRFSSDFCCVRRRSECVSRLCCVKTRLQQQSPFTLKPSTLMPICAEYFFQGLPRLLVLLAGALFLSWLNFPCDSSELHVRQFSPGCSGI